MRIGAIESVLHSWLIPWLEQLRTQQPQLELDITVETTPILTEQVQRGALDLAFAVLPTSALGVRNYALPPMEMAFVGHPGLHHKAKYELAELAEMEVLTFQKGSHPNVTLLDLFRKHHLQPKKVHAISSISAMVQLVQGSFGVALLPRAAVARLTGFYSLKLLECDVKLQPLPIHVSYRADPTANTIENVVKSAIAFVEEAENAPKKSIKGKP
jgi:DNA-binding transcriptional LysR family regulator